MEADISVVVIVDVAAAAAADMVVTDALAEREAGEDVRVVMVVKEAKDRLSSPSIGTTLIQIHLYII